MAYQEFLEILNELMDGSEPPYTRAMLADKTGISKKTIDDWYGGSQRHSISLTTSKKFLCVWPVEKVNELIEPLDLGPFSQDDIPDCPTQKDHPLVNIYLTKIENNHSFLDLSVFQEKQAREYSRVPLDEVYISLRLTWVAKDKPKPNISSKDLLKKMRAKNQELRFVVLMGEAGSGKTTILRRMILTLIQADAPLVPLFIPLRYYFRFCQTAKRALSTNSFFDFLAAHFKDSYDLYELTSDDYRQLLTQFRCLLAFDGLDEIPDIPARRRVLDIVYELSQSPKHVIILSSRKSAYGGLAQLGGDFQPLEVQCLTSDERDLQIERWVQTISDKTSKQLKAPDIQQRINENDTLKKLAVTPLIVTTLCVIHFHDLRLPESLAYIYNRCIDIMLHETYRKQDEGEAFHGFELVSFKKGLYSRFAFELHRSREESTNREQAMLWLKDGFTSLNPGDRIFEANRFLKHAMTFGVLLEESRNKYKFQPYHYAFREFLAGYHLVMGLMSHERNAYWSTILADDSYWLEAICLAVEVSVFEHTITCQNFLQSLAAVADDLDFNETCRMNSQRFVCQAIDRLGEKGRSFLQKDILDDMIERLCSDFAKDTTDKSPDPPSDPKKSQVLPSSLHFSLTDMLDGEFLFGVGNIPKTTQSFQAGLFPVTNAQFRIFMDEGGYENRHYWSPEGWEWLNTEQDHRGFPIIEPRYWNNSDFNGDKQPVVGVSYYEAEAFCQWLQYQNRIEGASCALPTVEEWERLARGKNGDEFPWSGQTIVIGHRNRCNTGHIEDKTTDVDHYPKGRSSTGAYDCVGNVWEWCATWTDENEHSRVLRGGSWNSPKSQANCTFADAGAPLGHSNDNIGFRIILRLSKH